MDYSSYIKEAFDIAKDHGFHDVELPVNHFIMLIITEISEMVEADRKNKRCQLDNFGKAGLVMNLDSGFVTKFESQVKDNLEDEMADACIRIFDLAGTFGWTLSDKHGEEEGYRAYRSVSQRKFTEIAYALCNLLTANGADSYNEQKCTAALAFMESWAKDLHFDLAWHIEQKMNYNKTRARLHGKQY
jgi:hypothetical protein